MLKPQLWKSKIKRYGANNIDLRKTTTWTKSQWFAVPIVQIWHSIRDNFDSLKDLGLKKAYVYEDRLNDKAKLGDPLTRLIGCTSPDIHVTYSVF